MIHVVFSMFLLLGLLAPQALAYENEQITNEEQEWLVWAKGFGTR